MTERSTSLVRMRGITVEFPGTKALDSVDIDLYPGEVHAILGQNGAGKSTLVSVLNGVLQPLSGSIKIANEQVTLRSPADALNAGISVVFQDIHLGPTLDVAENVMLGREARGRFGIDWARTREAAARQLVELGLGDLDLKATLGTLPPPIQQLVAIARAMVAQPRVLLLDEPTSSLEPADVSRLFAVIRRLRDSGVAILFISHYLEQVFTISDRMTVLRDGVKVGEFMTQETDRTELISSMFGEDIESLRRLGAERCAHQHDPEGGMVFEAKGVGLSGVFDSTDFELHAGEIVGFAGLRGSGRSELAQLLSGVWKSDVGVVLLEGQEVRYTGPGSGIKHRIAYSTEHRLDDGVISNLNVKENILLALQTLRGWSQPISRPEADSIIERYSALLGISSSETFEPAGSLSGGSQQRILLARWLATQPRVLILDEPTRGIDIGAKVEIQRRIAALADEGMAIIFISSDFDELLRICDRVVVLKDRQKIGEIQNGPAVTVDTLIEMIASDQGNSHP